jgi:hypothetical protein
MSSAAMDVDKEQLPTDGPLTNVCDPDGDLRLIVSEHEAQSPYYAQVFTFKIYLSNQAAI